MVEDDRMSEQERQAYRDWIARMADGGEFYREETDRMDAVIKRLALADGEARG